MTHTEILEEIYQVSLNGNKPNFIKELGLTKEEIDALEVVVTYAETRKAGTTVLITSLAHKILHPNQDIRLHQSNLPGGYSGRTVDTQYVTPFMKQKGFPAMVESGWLTRSFEQNNPYNLKYRGKITPPQLKEAFLYLIDNIQTKHANPTSYLAYLFSRLLQLKEKNHIEINPPEETSKYSIERIVHLLTDHFDKSSIVGTARLPVLAIYSVYECMMPQVKRYIDKKLVPLGSHTSADFRSGDIGDINILTKDDVPFEGVEIKYGKHINGQLVQDAYEKFRKYPVNRYYLLSTLPPLEEDIPDISDITHKIALEHGCQIIVNGLIPTLKYYLRLIDDTDEFIAIYTANVLRDPAIKTDHKEIWKTLIEQVAD